MTPATFGAPTFPDATHPALVDRTELAGSVVLGLVPLLLAAVVVAVAWWRSRDEMFVDVTPGLVPSQPGSARRRRLRSGEWNGTVAVAFTPPRGVTPGVAGTVVDGVADPHDVSATIVDLAVRGWFTIAEVPAEAGLEPAAPGPAEPVGRRQPRQGRSDRDWMLRRAQIDPEEVLTGFERTLVTDLFASGAAVRLSDLRGTFGMTMREAQIGLYREVVDRGWYRRHPRAKNARTRLWGLIVMVPLAVVAAAVVLRAGLVEQDWSFVPLLVGTTLTVLVLARWGRSRTPRTAEGTAVRIETLGFRHYLETAEADQIRFEEAGAVFSRYLPYAMAFGIAEAWARLFGEVAARAQLAGWTEPFWDLGWFDAIDLAGHSLDLVGNVASVVDVTSLGDLAGGLGDFASGLGDSLGDAVEAVAGTVGGLGDFTDAASGLLDLGGLLDGCDGCDGCDF
ncbi:hypothetical protein BA895_18760 [Humibacillus sp. DSM 29435]|uniref:DUF2207 domain-containing protein n=1 Tax=Humibacillus sp. DSM 29435 TaxID=1869167 RepID=UPI00087215AF|nr:DUF2207 domain-containing protein [Humibacillus sp. DSM 29435]OFE16377.1 hypothetical protein BA895_18760 [Humibacillus sp. DSM 29435]